MMVLQHDLGPVTYADTVRDDRCCDSPTRRGGEWHDATAEHVCRGRRHGSALLLSDAQQDPGGDPGHGGCFPHPVSLADQVRTTDNRWEIGKRFRPTQDQARTGYQAGPDVTVLAPLLAKPRRLFHRLVICRPPPPNHPLNGHTAILANTARMKAAITHPTSNHRLLSHQVP